MIGETRCDEKAGLRRDAVRSQVTKEPRPVEEVQAILGNEPDNDEIGLGRGLIVYLLLRLKARNNL
jgi:hypothetical protein